MGKNDGGAAFPVPMVFDGKEVTSRGLSLRDYFAGQALLMLAAGNRRPEDYATAAYVIADAMLKARADALPREK